MEEVLKHLEAYWDAAPGSVYANQHVLQAEIELRRIMEGAKAQPKAEPEVVGYMDIEGLTALEAKVLQRLVQLKNPQTTDQLADYFARSPKTMRKVMAGLRSRGLIQSERTGSNNSVQRHWV